ncbi:hypothetical protein [Streptomyces sp. NPDC001978]|uniref:hypothetical protein n=1 Tax=Streptomyces sp. NPDC001978 TaxID=3364627 RepID=UPI0036B95A0C
MDSLILGRIVPDVLVQSRRDAKAARRFMAKLLKKQCRIPRALVTDNTLLAWHRRLDAHLYIHKGIDNLDLSAPAMPLLGQRIQIRPQNPVDQRLVGIQPGLPAPLLPAWLRPLPVQSPSHRPPGDVVLALQGPLRHCGCR